MRDRFLPVVFSFVMLCGLVLVAGCGSLPQGEEKFPTGMDRDGTDANDVYSPKASIFGRDGLLFGKSDGGTEETGIGVNSFLWRASLDTVAFMPLASADPFGGVILTDWYSAPETPGERFKINVFILDKQLRSDGVQVKVFRQVRKGNEWRDADTGAAMSRELEDAILTRARQMRVTSMGGNR